MTNGFGVKELYSAVIKTTYEMEINGIIYAPNEPILRFDRLSIAALDEGKVRKEARGGSDGAVLMYWEDTNRVIFGCSIGTVSNFGLALISNSRLLTKTAGLPQDISYFEEKESNESNEIELRYTPKTGSVFIYGIENGVKITPVSIIGKTIILNSPYLDVGIDYIYEYIDKTETMKVGCRLINGYLSLEGRTRTVDESDGKEKTAVIKIPQIRLMSDLSMRLGDNRSPQVYGMTFEGVPVGEKGNRYVCEIIYLNNDIDTDL